MSEDISILDPINTKEFTCKKEEGVPYATLDPQEKKPQTIYFSPYSGVGVAFPQIQDEAIDSIYTDGEYWKDGQERVFTEKTSPGLYAMAYSRWQTVKPHLNFDSLSLLDIGAGHGYFGMVAAQDKDVKIKKYHVAEMDPTYRRSIQKTWTRFFPHIDVLAEERLSSINETYDLIVLSHVLEHLNNPKELLSQARALLKDKGCIFVDVPHQDYKFKGDVFPHVLFFSADSLKQLLDSAGYDVQFVHCYGKDMDKSPLNVRNRNSVGTFINKIIFKIRSILPLSFLVPYYLNYFGATHKNTNGTWIRLLAKKRDGV